MGQVITAASRGVAVGHGVIIGGERELLLHPLVRVAQCERRGALERYVKRYLCERQTCVTFTIGSFEAEARGLAREICAAKAVSQ